MRVIEYEMTWCDFLTPCPNGKMENETSPVMVGSHECYECKHWCGWGEQKHSIKCRYEIELD